jgi:ABC-type branched-subunit amino acid transport system substrate-binding protein/outer membrane protein assembly factor BamD (BamD/ComL family)
MDKRVKRGTFFTLPFFESALRNPKSEMTKLLICLLPLLFLQYSVLAQPQPEDTLLFREGEVLLSKGDTEKALWRFKKIITDHPQSSLLNEAKFRMGLCYTHLKRPKEAIRILNELFTSFLAPPRMVEVFSLLGENHLELRDPFSALQWYGKALLVPRQPQDELKRKVRAIIDSFETEEDLRRVESLYRGAYGGGYAKWRLAQMAKRRGNDLLAKNLMEEWKKEYPKTDYLSQSKEPTEPISRTNKSKFTVGAILPLSGVHQPYGERVLQAIQLAIKESDPSEKDSFLSLSLKDSKGDPVEAAKAVEELVNKENAIAILGPLLSIELDRVAKKAQELRIPVITFSQKEFQSGKNEFIFQNSLFPSDQIQTLVSFAVKTLELKTFGIFYPNSPYGLHYKNLFAQEISRQGGKVYGTVVYQEDQTDFSQEIRGFFKIEAVKEQDSPRRRWGDEFQSGITLDGLFVPDTHDRVGLILSQVAYYDVRGLRFLGTNAWNGPDLIRVAGKSAEGAVFVDAFFKRNPMTHSLRFAESFRNAYHRDPETLEALGYDGAKLLIEILRTKSIASPLQLNEEILRIQNFQGVSGLKGFGEGGRPLRTFFILKINNGQVEMATP